MYAREVDGQVLDFCVSGKLWKDSLVMMDIQTKSLWSHILGEAMAGPLEGKRLRQIPSLITDWATFRKTHPKGTVVVMPRTVTEYRRDFYTHHMFSLSGFVLGLVHKDKAYAWRLSTLREQPVLNEVIEGTPMAVMFDPKATTARVFDRRMDGKVLHFVASDGAIKDRETDSIWDPAAGIATSGPLQGKQLRPMPAILSRIDAWHRFHSESSTK